MKNSPDTIIRDLKKLMRELEESYGEVQPLVCNVTSGLESCPNTKCWVQRVRNEQSDKIFETERVILESLNLISEIKKSCSDPKILKQIHQVYQMLDYLINPTPCSECLKNENCNREYKSMTIHDLSCSEFENKNNTQEDTPKVALQF